MSLHKLVFTAEHFTTSKILTLKRYKEKLCSHCAVSPMHQPRKNKRVELKCFVSLLYHLSNGSKTRPNRNLTADVLLLQYT